MRPPPARHRRCIVLRGPREQTQQHAAALVCDLTGVLWISRTEPGALRPPQVRRHLGTSADAAIIDLHDGADADLLGQCHGFVRGGGALILRMPTHPPESARTRLVSLPYTADDVGMRFWARLEQHLAHLPPPPDEPLAPPPPIEGGTDEQADVAAALSADFMSAAPTFSVLIADRGRGKSSALGLGLRAAVSAGLRVAITADSARSAAEVVRFSGGQYAPPLALLEAGDELDVLVIDEAARLPVPLLQALVRRHPDTHIAFASTVRGYEGTGRGFVLRFLRWLSQQPRPLRRHDLQQPIRWAADDPVERLIFDLLALDAAPGAPPVDGPLVAEAISQDALAGDEGLLRQAFGLLVHAHYRTTPGDLQRILDAPNLRLHVLRRGGAVVAVTLLALEGGLSAAVCAQLAAGQQRLRGHALPDTLISHAGATEAGTLSMIRSVRIATHPGCRRQGLARRLVAHVHRQYAPDLFGTMFGATEALLQFRRAVGYELVRLGVSRGSRTGEPSAVMLRPCTPQAVRLVSELRVLLAGDLPVLLSQGEELPLSEGMRAALAAGLPEPVPLSDDDILAAVRRYAYGPCPSDVVMRPLQALAERHGARLSMIPGGALLCQRVCDGVPWRVLAAASGQSIPAAQRQARRATRALLRQLGS